MAVPNPMTLLLPALTTVALLTTYHEIGTRFWRILTY
jgi:hypothetical protein